MIEYFGIPPRKNGRCGMSKLIKATDASEAISKKFNIPMYDLVDVFAEVPPDESISKEELLKVRDELYKGDMITIRGLGIINELIYGVRE